MKRFVVGESRNQSTLFPERLDEYIAEDNPVRVIDVFNPELSSGCDHSKIAISVGIFVFFPGYRRDPIYT